MRIACKHEGGAPLPMVIGYPLLCGFDFTNYGGVGTPILQTALPVNAMTDAFYCIMHDHDMFLWRYLKSIGFVWHLYTSLKIVCTHPQYIKVRVI